MLPPPGTPLLLELRSRSGAGEDQGDTLGLYHLTIDPREESKRQGLVYRQLHNGDNQRQYYLYRWEKRLHITHLLTKFYAAYFSGKH